VAGALLTLWLLVCLMLACGIARIVDQTPVAGLKIVSDQHIVNTTHPMFLPFFVAFTTTHRPYKTNNRFLYLDSHRTLSPGLLFGVLGLPLVDLEKTVLTVSGMNAKQTTVWNRRSVPFTFLGCRVVLSDTKNP
jgi:hypothetical protein